MESKRESMPLQSGELSPEISKGFEAIMRNITDNKLKPIACIKQKIDDENADYEITCKMYSNQAPDEIGDCEIIIRRECRKKVVSYKLMDFQETKYERE